MLLLVVKWGQESMLNNGIELVSKAALLIDMWQAESSAWLGPPSSSTQLGYLAVHCRAVGVFW